MKHATVVRLAALTLLAICTAIPSTAQRTGARADRQAAAGSDVGDSLVISDAWARPALEGGTGGAYMHITNRSHGVIRVVSASATAATSAALHVSSVQNGIATMQMLPQLLITPGASVSLEPGGIHFMLTGLRKALVRGDTTRLLLQLQNGAEIAVRVAVRSP